jgi:chromosome partitioning protein
VIVTVANRKGGVGKTTASVFLAHALAAATGQACALVDADPQASAATWARRAAEAGQPLAVAVAAHPTARLGARLPTTPNVVIDTPPGEADIVAAAIEVADLVLVPTSPSAMDLSVVETTVAAATRRGKPAAVLLTCTRRTRSVGAAEEALRAAGVRLLRTHIALREALAMAFGRPVRDLHGYDLATAELLGLLPDQPYSVAAVQRRADQPRAGHRPAPRPQLPRNQGRHREAPAALRALAPAPAAAEPVDLSDDALIQRLKTSMARLGTQR